MTTLPVRTTQPDYRFATKEQWLRYIQLELHQTKMKNDLNRAMEILQPRLKIRHD